MGQRLVPFSLKSGHLIWFKCFHFGALDPTTQDLRLVCRLRRRPWVLFLSFFFIYLFFLRNKPYGWLPTNTNSDSFTKKQPSIPDHLPHRGCVLPLTENCAPPWQSTKTLPHSWAEVWKGKTYDSNMWETLDHFFNSFYNGNSQKEKMGHI